MIVPDPGKQGKLDTIQESYLEGAGDGLQYSTLTRIWPKQDSKDAEEERSHRRSAQYLRPAERICSRQRVNACGGVTFPWVAAAA